jgi:catechol 2,3-dioxygenase-like lactoylglutathione lyase family enzyme
MGRIRYLAVISRDPTRLADFYQHQIGMERVARSSQGDVSLTDGYFKLAIFKQREDLGELRNHVGLHHLGVEVESIAETLNVYRQIVPGGVALRELGDPHHGEARIFDPECNAISLSERGFGMSAEPQGLPRIGHIALHMLQPQRSGDFFMKLFGMRELGTTGIRRKEGRFNCFLGDGHTNLALHPYYRTRDGEGFAVYNRIGHDGAEEKPTERRFGIHHFGILMPDAQRRAAALSDVGAPVADRPAVRPYAEYRVLDPDGNGIDFSETKGWEVDLDKWEHAS